MKKLIVTFHQKKYNSFLAAVETRFKDYAIKCNADFLNVEIPHDTEKPLLYKFFYIGNSLPKFDRYLVIDLDIIIKKNSPNIFDFVPKEKLGLYMESGAFHTVTGADSGEISVRWNCLNDLMKSCGLEFLHMEKTYYFDNPFKYYNNGVVVYNKEHLNLHAGFSAEQKEKIYKYNTVCLDQHLLNYAILKNNTKIYNLPVCFNQMPYNRYCDYKETSFFSHYAGLQEKIKSDQLLSDHSYWLENNF